jgi:hypothetical protein
MRSNRLVLLCGLHGGTRSEYESSIIGATHGLGMIDSPGVGVELAF